VTGSPNPSDLPAVAAFDAKVDALFEGWRGHAGVDRVFYTASALGDFSLVWHLLGAAQALGPDPALTRALRLSVSLGVESLVVNQGIKRLFRRSRPEPRDRPLRLREPSTSSFPSGHASSAFMAAALLSDGTPFAPAIYALAAVVALSRVHVGIHHASDVVCGAALGVALGAVARSLWPLP
jgi:membrane-associated phospholipid phosphatase